MISLGNFGRRLFSRTLVRSALASDARSVSETLVRTRQTSNKNHLPKSYLAGLKTEKYEIEYRNAATNPSNREILLVATRGDSMLGFIHGKPTEDAPGEDAIELKEIYIAPKAQRRRVGTALLRKFMKDARAMGVKNVWVWVLENNIGARKFYEKSGADHSHTATRVIGGVECNLVVYVWSEKQMGDL